MADKVIEIFEMTDGIMKSGMSEKERNAMGYLISETTKEEREKIVAESLGNIDAACDGCMSGLVEMYQDYIDGKKELREINMEFNARYVKSEDMPGREGRGKSNEFRKRNPSCTFEKKPDLKKESAGSFGSRC